MLRRIARNAQWGLILYQPWKDRRGRFLATDDIGQPLDREYVKECFREWVKSADLQNKSPGARGDNGHRSGGQVSATGRGTAGRQSALPAGVINTPMSQSRVVAVTRCRSPRMPMSLPSVATSRGECRWRSQIIRIIGFSFFKGSVQESEEGELEEAHLSRPPER